MLLQENHLSFGALKDIKFRMKSNLHFKKYIWVPTTVAMSEYAETFLIISPFYSPSQYVLNILYTLGTIWGIRDPEEKSITKLTPM